MRTSLDSLFGTREGKMALDSKRLAMDIAENVRAAAAAHPAPSSGFAPGARGETAGASAAASGDFCSIWPKAKPVLELVAGVVNFIPGAGTTAGGVLQGLIKVGDQISAEVCK
jgi:hypothetical protein